MADTEDRPEVEQCALAMLAAIRGTRRASGPLEKAEHLLASSWLAARDERIRADEREKLAAEMSARRGHTETCCRDAELGVERLAGQVEALRDKARDLVQEHMHGPRPNPSRAGAWAAVVRELDGVLVPVPGVRVEAR